MKILAKQTRLLSVNSQDPCSIWWRQWLSFSFFYLVSMLSVVTFPSNSNAMGMLCPMGDEQTWANLYVLAMCHHQETQSTGPRAEWEISSGATYNSKTRCPSAHSQMQEAALLHWSRKMHGEDTMAIFDADLVLLLRSVIDTFRLGGNYFLVVDFFLGESAEFFFYQLKFLFSPICLMP